MFTFIWDGKVDIFLDSIHGENRHRITNSPLSKAYYKQQEKYFKAINDSIIQRSIKMAKLDRVRDSAIYMTLVGEQKELLEKQYAIAKEFIKKKPSSFLSLEFLDWLWPLLLEKEKRDYYDRIKRSQIKHPYTDIFEQRLKDESEVSVGKRLDFSLISIDGQNIDLMKFRGKYVLIDFWGSWCGPCIRAIPELTKIYSEYRQTGKIEFLSISVEREHSGLAESKKIISDKGMNWVHVIQMESDLSEILKNYQVAAYPTQVLLDKEGKIALYLVGATENNMKILKDYLFEQLKRGL